MPFCVRLFTNLLVMAVVAVCAAPAAARPPRHARDPLVPIVHRMNRYFHRNEIDGVTLDRRYDLSPSEVIRLSVVCQLLGYAELYHVHPSRVFRRDIVERADYLLPRFDQVRSGSTFDGMLGDAMLEAYDVTRDPRYLGAGRRVVQEIEDLGPYDTILNGGLMGALALAKYHQLTGDEPAAQRTRDILAALLPYQHADGSFPHWCECSKDVHYTDWMSMELILLQRMLPDPSIEPMLERMLAFMETRIEPDGDTRYQDPCATCPGGVEYYYSIATGCGIDYDTRAFTNELGYSALLFDRFDSPRYGPVIRFMERLERGGTFKDKWAYWPPPSDPYYPWTASDTSVVNMSVIFWSLTSIIHGRVESCPADRAWVAEAGEDEEVPAPVTPVRLPALASLAPSEERATTRFLSRPDALLASGGDPRAACDSPARGPAARAVVRAPVADGAPPPLQVAAQARGGAATIQFTLPARGYATLRVHDLAGRRVRSLIAQWLPAGVHRVTWDLDDDRGGRRAPGIYFVRLVAAERSAVTRVVVTP